MTKKEQYEELRRAGVELKAINRLSSEEVAAIYREFFGDPAATNEPPAKKPEPEPEPARPIPALYFDHSGWCEELQDSYFQGHYQPASWNEYKHLQKHAAKPTGENDHP
jgi:hypothetical protein